MATFTTSFSQVLDANCIFIEPEDTTGISIDTINHKPLDDFPDWDQKPFQLNGKRKYGSGIGNKMEIVLNYATFQNYYTTHAGVPRNNKNGIDNKSMFEFAKEKYRKDVLEKFLKDTVPCTESNDYYVFSFISKKNCNRETKCKIKMGPYACCSNDTNNTFANMPEGFEVVNENGQNYLLVTRSWICGQSCCEERYHYVCNPNASEPSASWVLSYRDFTDYVGTECSPYPYSNQNCPINTPSTCKSGCGE